MDLHEYLQADEGKKRQMERADHRELGRLSHVGKGVLTFEAITFVRKGQPFLRDR